MRVALSRDGLLRVDSLLPRFFLPAAHEHPLHLTSVESDGRALESESAVPTCTSEYQRSERRVLFYETDAAGIVHFSWFFRYMEEAEHALWREAGSVHPPARRRHRVAARRRRRASTTARCASSRSSTSPSASTEIDRRTITFACVITRGR